MLAWNQKGVCYREIAVDDRLIYNETSLHHVMGRIKIK